MIGRNMERKVHERTQEVQFQKALLESITEASDEAIVVHSPEGRILNCNQRFLKMWGLPTDSAGGDIAAILDQMKEQVVNGDTSFGAAESADDARRELRLKDGRIIEHYSTAFEATGVVSGKIWFFQDVTLSRRATQELRAVVHNARCILYNADVEGLQGWEDDPSGTRNLYNRTVRVQDEEAAQQVLPLKLAPGETYWMKWKPSRHPEDLPRMSERAARAFVNGDDSYEHVWRCFDSSGNIVYLHEVASIERLAPGRWRVVGVCTNVTEQKRAQEALQESENRFSLFMKYFPGAVSIKDSSGKLQFYNDALRNVFGWEGNEGIGQKISSFLPPDIAAVHEADEREIVQTGRARQVTREFQFKGKSVKMLLTLFPIPGPGKLLGGIASDISELKRTETHLIYQKAMLESVLEASNDGVLAVSAEGKWLACNSRFIEMWKIPDDVSSRGFEDEVAQLMLPQLKEPDRFLATMTHLQLNRDEAVGDEALLLNDGRILNRRSSPIRGIDGTNYGRVWFFSDVTQEVQNQDQLRTLTSELILAEERERRAMATVLHDHVGQILALTSMKLEALEEVTDGDLKQQVRQIMSLNARAIQRTRSLTVELSPPVLYEVGLEAAIEWLAAEVRRNAGIEVSVERHDAKLTLANERKVFLFQIVRELLNNIVKHAKARHVRISLRRRADKLLLAVEDDGVGFDEAEIASAASRNSFGLFSVRERLRHLEGNLQCQSEPGQGSRFWITVPVEKANDAHPAGSTGGVSASSAAKAE
jgi:PAS domain S-box-containing protein